MKNSQKSRNLTYSAIASEVQSGTVHNTLGTVHSTNEHISTNIIEVGQHLKYFYLIITHQVGKRWRDIIVWFICFYFRW